MVPQNTRDFSYCKGDTHWTDFGASAAAGVTLQAWGLSLDGLNQEWQVKQRIGDLGGKLQPRVANYQLMFPEDVARRLAYDNGITNNGCIRIYENAEASRNETLLILGDSFGTNLAEAFSGVFSKVAYAYLPGAMDTELATIVKPQHVILEITQRFLPSSPPVLASVFSVARTKLEAMPSEHRLTLAERAATVDPRYIPFVKPVFG